MTAARWVQADWLNAKDVQGDVAIAVHVTYFVREIVPFLRALQERARRYVAIVVASVPPPGNMAGLFAAVFGAPLARRPGHRELLRVLWELGILPDIHVFMESEMAQSLVVTRAEAETTALRAIGAMLDADVSEDRQLTSAVRMHFDELFTPVEGGWQPRWVVAPSRLLISWETGPHDTERALDPGVRTG
jgi:hypothetical protein